MMHIEGHMAGISHIGEAAIRVLGIADADKKAHASHEAAKLWREGELSHGGKVDPPDRPARPGKPELLSPAKMPRRRKGGSQQNRIALLHALAHIELNAIDLAWDIIARFGHEMPGEFIDDWVRVGDDEAKHFLLLNARLSDMGAFYGALPAHDGLWEASQATAHSLAARLAVVPMVLEARGLDVTPGLITRFQSMGDSASAEILSIIYEDEIGHVTAGRYWFDWLCKADATDAKDAFQSLVSKYFCGSLKRPFNKQARDQAGFPASFYEPLASEAGQST